MVLGAAGTADLIIFSDGNIPKQGCIRGRICACHDMNSIYRITCIALILVSSIGRADAQTRQSIDVSADFNIASGSTFSASGRAPSWWGVKAERPSWVAADIGEAQAIIRTNHISTGGDPVTGLTRMAIEGMLRALDPHSHFYGETEWKDLLDEQRSEYAGIGVTIANFEKDGAIDTFVLSTLPGSPAAKARLAFGDRIVAVDGESTTNRGPDLARDKIRGPVGRSFRLTVERAASLQLETIEIMRDRVPQPSIPDAYILRPGVGYIDLSEGFNYTTSDELDAALRELKRAGMASLVLDLRGNGGGIVEQAVKVAEKFLPFGTKILTQRGRTSLDNREWTSRNPSPEKMPLVVIVDRNTASASEIVAGAFQDHDRAMIVGEKTFGKGLVQSVIRLPGGAGVTLTTGRYLTPSGRSIQRVYSSGDIYDYFSHRSPAAGIDRPFFEARTAANRKVYGGDGIQPDEDVRADTLTPLRGGLVDPIFFFIREAVYGRVKGHENLINRRLPYSGRVVSSDLTISDSLLRAFETFLDNNYNGGAQKRLAAELSFVRTRLRYNLAIACYGSTSANQVLVEGDQQVYRAIATLPKAAELSKLARPSAFRSK